MNKDWLKAHAEEEINGAKVYFSEAEQCSDEDNEKMFIELGQQELHHAGVLYGMLAMM